MFFSSVFPYPIAREILNKIFFQEGDQFSTHNKIKRALLHLFVFVFVFVFVFLAWNVALGCNIYKRGQRF